MRLVFNYRPRRFDLAALRAGRLAELLNLVPLGGVDLQLPGLALGARQGGGALAAGILSHWLDDITSTQVVCCWCMQCVYSTIVSHSCTNS